MKYNQLQILSATIVCNVQLDQVDKHFLQLIGLKSRYLGSLIISTKLPINIDNRFNAINNINNAE